MYDKSLTGILRRFSLTRGFPRPEREAQKLQKTQRERRTNNSSVQGHAQRHQSSSIGSSQAAKQSEHSEATVHQLVRQSVAYQKRKARVVIWENWITRYGLNNGEFNNIDKTGRFFKNLEMQLEMPHTSCFWPHEHVCGSKFQF